MTRRIAIATYDKLPGLTDDEALLLPELRSRGVEVTPVVWNDRGTDWDTYDAVLVRCTWDYHLHYLDFLDWVRTVERVSELWNTPSIIRWNSHKSYLLDLERRGVPIVPTLRVRRRDAVQDLMGRAGWNEAVLKPMVSADGHRTFLLRAGDRSENERKFKAVMEAGDALLQPYLQEVERSGERSLVFFGKEFSHAFVRAPKLGAAPHLREGSPCTASPAEIEIGRKAIAAVPSDTLYARVDLVPDERGSFRLMELELIEPALQIGTSPGAPARFATAFLALL